MCILYPQMNAVRGGTVTWRPQPWQDGNGGGGEPLSDSDSEEEDFPDDSTTPLGDYITHGETKKNYDISGTLFVFTRFSQPFFLPWHSFFVPFILLCFRVETAPGCSAAV